MSGRQYKSYLGVPFIFIFSQWYDLLIESCLHFIVPLESSQFDSWKQDEDCTNRRNIFYLLIYFLLSSAFVYFPSKILKRPRCVCVFCLQFCKLYMTTNEQCLKNALEKLEVDSKLKRQQFGSQLETSSELATSLISKTIPKTARKTESKPMLKRGNNFSSKKALVHGA